MVLGSGQLTSQKPGLGSDGGLFTVSKVDDVTCPVGTRVVLDEKSENFREWGIPVSTQLGVDKVPISDFFDRRRDLRRDRIDELRIDIAQFVSLIDTTSWSVVFVSSTRRCSTARSGWFVYLDNDHWGPAFVCCFLRTTSPPCIELVVGDFTVALFPSAQRRRC